MSERGNARSLIRLLASSQQSLPSIRLKASLLFAVRTSRHVLAPILQPNNSRSAVCQNSSSRFSGFPCVSHSSLARWRISCSDGFGGITYFLPFLSPNQLYCSKKKDRAGITPHGLPGDCPAVQNSVPTTQVRHLKSVPRTAVEMPQHWN